MKKPKKPIDLKRTLNALEQSLEEWDNIRADIITTPAKSETRQKREAELALKTHLLFQALRDQIHELS